MPDSIKLSDYVAQFFYRLGTRHAFVVSGGASLHLIHSVASIKDFLAIPCHHEQSAAMAADAYTRVTTSPGLAIATSGPGATNLITGIAGCYYDSVPAFFITGQVSTFRMSRNKEVRQTGFQETPIVEMVSEITNYACQITHPDSIRYELEKASYLSTHGRPGPVLLDIPDNLQRSLIDPQFLASYNPTSIHPQQLIPSADNVQLLYKQLIAAKRPVLIAGWGIRLARADDLFLKLVEMLNIPVALTWGGSDLLPFDHPLRIGTFGTHGSRYSNFAVQNADFILAIGTRLDTKSTGSPPSTFARQAFLAVNDISLGELDKFAEHGLEIHLKLHCDARLLIDHLIACKPADIYTHSSWMKKIAHWKSSYPVLSEPRDVGDLVDPYHFFAKLSSLISPESQVWSDTGSVIAWLMQAFEPRYQQRVWHDFNNTAMGWALPAAISSCLGKPQSDAFCIVGDGSLMMNIQELQTAVTHHLPIKIICFDNGGYSMIKQTQEQWLGSNYVASESAGGLTFPDLAKVASAFGYPVKVSSTTEDALRNVEWLSLQRVPAFLLLKVSPHCRVAPQVKYGRPNEDPEPLLDRETFFHEMIVTPISPSDQPNQA